MPFKMDSKGLELVN